MCKIPANGKKSTQLKRSRKQKKINPMYTRIDRIDRIRKAYIMWEDLPIAELYHEYLV